MKSELQHFLSQLRNIQEDIRHRAMTYYRQDSPARNDLLRIESRLARTLGELDYLVNLKIGTPTDDRLSTVQRKRD